MEAPKDDRWKAVFIDSLFAGLVVFLNPSENYLPLSLQAPVESALGFYGGSFLFPLSQVTLERSLLSGALSAFFAGMFGEDFGFLEGGEGLKVFKALSSVGGILFSYSLANRYHVIQ